MTEIESQRYSVSDWFNAMRKISVKNTPSLVEILLLARRLTRGAAGMARAGFCVQEIVAHQINYELIRSSSNHWHSNTPSWLIDFNLTVMK